MRANLTLQQLKAFTQPLSIDEQAFQGINPRQKEAVRAKLEADIQAFLNAGNAIDRLPEPNWRNESRKVVAQFQLESVA